MLKQCHNSRTQNYEVHLPPVNSICQNVLDFNVISTFASMSSGLLQAKTHSKLRVVNVNGITDVDTLSVCMYNSDF